MKIADLDNIGWIPLSVAMPTIYTGCIVTDGENTAWNSMYIVANRDSNEHIIQWKSNNNLWKPTHWMPLPKVK